MALLILGLLVFFAIHAIPLTPAKEALIARFGGSLFQAGFSLIALAGFALIIVGYGQAPSAPLWSPLPFSRELTFILMPPALILMAAAYLKSDIKRYVRHPMLTSIAIWALTHLAANGDLASSLLFASFGIYAALDIMLTKKTSPPPEKCSLQQNLITIAVGLLASTILVYFHKYVAGVPLLPP